MVAEFARSRSLGLGGTGARIGHLLDGERIFGYVLVAPAVAYILLLVGYPFAIAVWFTVSNATTARPIAEFTGLTNLLAVLDDDIFRRALANTFIFTITSQALQMVLGTILAFLLLQNFRGRRIARALIMIPFTIPIAIGAMAWTWMLNPTYSVINWMGVHAGLFTEGPNWLGEEYPAMISIISPSLFFGSSVTPTSGTFDAKAWMPSCPSSTSIVTHSPWWRLLKSFRKGIHWSCGISRVIMADSFRFETLRSG